MHREPDFPHAATGKVVHVVGVVTDEIFSFLGPATHTLAGNGLQQCVVMIDDARYRQHLVALDETAELVLVPRQRGLLTQWRAVTRAARAAMQGGPLHAVHLHGVLPCLGGVWAMRSSGVDAPVFVSPHGSRLVSELGALGALGMLLLKPLLPSAKNTVIVNVAQESRSFDSWSHVDLVESPAAAAYFQVPRHEARHPLMVTGGQAQTARSAERLAQLAVLLSGTEPVIAFNWIGSVDSVSKLRLSAAGVGVFAVQTDEQAAARLGAGWVYVAPGGTRGFPLYLVNAMAAGLPCVALDCEQHREVVQHGETGFLCKSEREMIDHIARLVDDHAMRQRMGQAARARAGQRFGGATFSDKLLAAYALPRESQPMSLLLPETLGRRAT